MITVAGEALMDVLADEGGTLTPLPGGAPYNVARFVAMLGEDCTFLGRLSDDPFGARLRRELSDAGVTLATPEPVTAPTTLAMAQLDATGSADYRFYGAGTSAAALRPSDVPAGLLAGGRAFALGGLGTVFEPIRSTLLELLEAAPRELLVVLDPNCRPHAITDLDDFRATIDRLLARTDVLKVSLEDLAVLCPGGDPRDYGVGLVGRGPAVVLITAGADGLTLATAEGVRAIPVPAVEVVDTIGAGDAFVAGILAWLAVHADIDPRTAGLDALEAAVAAALEVSGAACRVRGAALPGGFVWSERSSAG
jgi:fructokinase